MPWRKTYMHMRLVKTPRHGTERQLVIEFDDQTDEWAYYATAFDRYGHRLNVNGLGTMMPCVGAECFITDTVAVSFPVGYLESYVVAGRGLDFKIFGRHDEMLVKVPAGYVAGFVQATGFNRN